MSSSNDQNDDSKTSSSIVRDEGKISEDSFRARQSGRAVGASITTDNVSNSYWEMNLNQVIH